MNKTTLVATVSLILNYQCTTRNSSHKNYQREIKTPAEQKGYVHYMNRISFDPLLAEKA